VTPTQARLTAAERRLAELEARVRRAGSGTRQVRQGRALAIVAGKVQGAAPPPWMPRGTVPATYKATGCNGRPAGGVTITTLYNGLVVDVRTTGPDGYATFPGVAGVPYTYQAVIGGRLAARTGSYTLAAGGQTVAIAMTAAPPYVCAFDCGTPVGPPFRMTDPAGTFVGTPGATFGPPFTFLALQLVRTMPSVAAAADCSGIAAGPVNCSYRTQGSPPILQVSYLTCSGPGAGYPLRYVPPQSIPSNFTIQANLTSYNCSPFEMRWTFTGALAAKFFGADPAVVVLTEANP
jgi:hypothetical protein